MIIKIKKKGLFLDSREKYSIKIDNFIFKEDFMQLGKEKFNIFFKKNNLSGIIELDKEEFEALVNAGSQRKNILNEIDFLKAGVEDISFQKRNIENTRKYSIKNFKKDIFLSEIIKTQILIMAKKVTTNTKFKEDILEDEEELGWQADDDDWETHLEDTDN